jgi:G:T-mismatch repair DNA endonuclease (very short patch repair protein)
MRKILNTEVIVNDYKNGMGIYDVCDKYHIGKLTLKKLLTENGIEIRKKGKQPLNKPYIVSDWKIEKFPLREGYHWIAIAKNNSTIQFKDIKNEGGHLSEYVKNTLRLKVPTLYDRREYYKLTGNDWFEQYFTFSEIKNSESKKCPYCNWETIDLENKSGAFEMHLQKEHGISIEKYLKKHPEDCDYFHKHKIKKERAELFEDKYNFVSCPICGEKMVRLTESHLQKHHITWSEFNIKYPSFQKESELMMDKDRSVQSKANLKVSKNRFISHYERELQEFLIKNGFEIMANRQILNGKEIDILIESKKIGIEFDGLFFHSEQHGKERGYHLSKTNLCNKNGYGLIHIFEDEYYYHKNLIYSKLAHILGLHTNLPKIAGRKIIIKEINSDDAKIFLDAYHIQGFANSTNYIGGFFKNKLVAVMTFKKTGFGRKEEYELNRYATNYNFIYQGVGSKLFNFFIKTYNPKSIVSFADRRWTLSSDNNIYTKIGFKFAGNTRPNYTYFNTSRKSEDFLIRHHRLSFKKSVLYKKYPFLPKDKTEEELAALINYYKIWDCGMFKYVWTNPNIKDCTLSTRQKEELNKSYITC